MRVRNRWLAWAHVCLCALPPQLIKESTKACPRCGVLIFKVRAQPTSCDACTHSMARARYAGTHPAPHAHACPGTAHATAALQLARAVVTSADCCRCHRGAGADRHMTLCDHVRARPGRRLQPRDVRALRPPVLLAAPDRVGGGRRLPEGGEREWERQMTQQRV
jgi:hypothetical protein